jgi:hypothetical protein
MDYKGGQHLPDCQCKSNILNNFSLESTPSQGGQHVPDYPLLVKIFLFVLFNVPYYANIRYLSGL